MGLAGMMALTACERCKAGSRLLSVRTFGAAKMDLRQLRAERRSIEEGETQEGGLGAGLPVDHC